MYNSFVLYKQKVNIEMNMESMNWFFFSRLNLYMNKLNEKYQVQHTLLSPFAIE